MQGMSSVPVSLLPGNFGYYAAGHIHIRKIYSTEKGSVAFPGPLFPTSFDELEHYNSGFYIVHVDGGKIAEIQDVPVKMFDTLLIEKDISGRTPAEAESMIIDELRDMPNTVLLLKLRGVLNGRPSDIDFRGIAERAGSLGAICVKKNISKLSSERMEESAVENVANIDDLERRLVAQHADRMKLGSADAGQLVLSLMNVLKDEKGEETNATFEEKIKENAKKLLGL